MASYLNPQPSNAILDDIANIRELENYNAQNDPSLGSDFPVGAKRFVNIGTPTAPKWQWQRYDGTSWQVMANTTTDKLMHNVDMLDGYHASTSAVENTIPVYNADKLLVGGITGNATTATKLATARNLQVGGIASGEAKPFDGTAAVTLPIESINVNNDEDDAIVGVLTAKHGGTGRTDGAAQDVSVDSIAGEVSAKAYGQIGQATELTASTHLDTLTVDGWYMAKTELSITTELGYPENTSGYPLVRVSSSGASIIQEFSVGGSRQYQRQSGNSGASWSGWMPIGGTVSGTVKLWVSKSGSDNNSGLSESSPLLTINKALRIAAGLNVGGTNNSYVMLCVGEGDWGDVILRTLPFPLFIYPFNGARPTEYSNALPRFRSLQVRGMSVTVAGIVADSVVASSGGTIFVDGGYKRIGAVRALQSSHLMFLSSTSASNVWEIHSQDVYADAIISVSDDASIDFAGYLHIRLAENLTASTVFLSVGRNARFGCFKNRTVFDATNYTFTGKKFSVANTAVLNSAENEGAGLFFTEDLPGEGGSFVLGTIVNGFTVGQASKTEVDEAISVVDEAISALDAAVVKLTGDQTIEGQKSFMPAVDGDVSSMQLRNPNDRSSGSAVQTEYTVCRRSGKVHAAFGYSSDGNNVNEKAYIRYENMYGYGAELSVDDEAGYAPSTPDGAEGNEIVTADFLRKSAGKSVGDRWEGYDPASVPANVQLYSGQLLSRAAYEAHSALVFSGKRTVVTEEAWQAMVAERGWCPWFSEGDGSTTYRFPLVKGVFAEYVASLEEAGQYIEAGLPDHKHTLTQTGTYNSASNGSNTVFTVGMSEHMQQVNQGRGLINNASEVNAIYGNSDTVQPPALTHLIGEYVVGGVAVLGEADAESLLASVTHLDSEVARKMDGNAIGSWVYSFLEASHVVILGDYSIDVSSYLPSDSKNYEVLVKLYVNRSDNSGTNTNSKIFLPGQREASNPPCIQCVADGTNFQQANASGLVPVGADRVINYSITGYKPNEAKFEIFAYRRVI